MCKNGPVINQGAGGFHLWTVVTDGFGNYISEDETGGELARVRLTGHTNADALRDMTELTRLTLRASDPNGELGVV